MKKQLFLIALILLASLSYSESEKICNNGNTVMNISNNELYTYVMIIVMIQIVLAGLAYMYSGITMSSELKAWGRNEIMQGIFTLIVVATYFGLATTIGTYLSDMVSNLETTNDHLSVAKNACFNNETYRWSVDNCNTYKELKTPEDKAFYAARAYIGLTYERLGEILTNALRGMFLYGAVDSYAISIGFAAEQADSFGIYFSSGFPMHAVMINTLKNLTDLIVKLLMTIKFQEAILMIINEGGLGQRIFILGILFRSVWFLRKAGGLMIALGIGLMFVLPFLYMLGWYTIDINPFKGIFDSTSIVKHEIDTFDTAWYKTLGAIQGASAATLLTLYAIGVANLFSVGGKIQLAFLPADAIYSIMLGGVMIEAGNYSSGKGLIAPNLYTDFSKPEKGIGYFDLISRYLLIALALPIINLYFLLSFVRSLSPLLGGDHTIPGIARLI
ncbi:MAG: hypothetical protein ACP5KJ_03130 [Candidatus Micrarchaeia archaeon]